MTWTADDLTWLGYDEAVSEGDIAVVRVGTPAGEIMVMASVSFEGRTLVAAGAHIQSDAGANATTFVNLRAIASFVLERLDCDEARVEGAVRTSGANPGHRPRVLRFARRPRAAVP